VVGQGTAHPPCPWGHFFRVCRHVIPRVDKYFWHSLQKAKTILFSSSTDPTFLFLNLKNPLILRIRVSAAVCAEGIGFKGNKSYRWLLLLAPSCLIKFPSFSTTQPCPSFRPSVTAPALGSSACLTPFTINGELSFHQIVPCHLHRHVTW
jgi:hypothetical protein